MPRPRKNRAQRALSLVETVALAGLIVLIVLLCLGLVPSLKLSNRKADQELKAGRFAQSLLESQRALPFESVVATPPETLMFEGQEYEMAVEVTPGSQPDITKRVRVRLRWSWREQPIELFRETVLVQVPR